MGVRDASGPHRRGHASGARHRPQSRRARPVPGSHRARKYQLLHLSNQPVAPGGIPLSAPSGECGAGASPEFPTSMRPSEICNRPNRCYHCPFLYDDANVTISRHSGHPADILAWHPALSGTGLPAVAQALLFTQRSGPAAGRRACAPLLSRAVAVSKPLHRYRSNLSVSF